MKMYVLQKSSGVGRKYQASSRKPKHQGPPPPPLDNSQSSTQSFLPRYPQLTCNLRAGELPVRHKGQIIDQDLKYPLRRGTKHEPSLRRSGASKTSLVSSNSLATQTTRRTRYLIRHSFVFYELFKVFSSNFKFPDLHPAQSLK